MRKIREILRLRAAGKSQHLIALSVGIGQSTVGDCLTRARLAGVSWPTPLDDAALEGALYPAQPREPYYILPRTCRPPLPLHSHRSRRALEFNQSPCLDGRRGLLLE